MLLTLLKSPLWCRPEFRGDAVILAVSAVYFLSRYFCQNRQATKTVKSDDRVSSDRVSSDSTPRLIPRAHECVPQDAVAFTSPKSMIAQGINDGLHECIEIAVRMACLPCSAAAQFPVYPGQSYCINKIVLV